MTDQTLREAAQTVVDDYDAGDYDMYSIDALRAALASPAEGAADLAAVLHVVDPVIDGKRGSAGHSPSCEDRAARLAAAGVRVVTVERLARALRHALISAGTEDADAAAILAAMDAEP